MEKISVVTEDLLSLKITGSIPGVSSLLILPPNLHQSGMCMFPKVQSRSKVRTLQERLVGLSWKGSASSRRAASDLLMAYLGSQMFVGSDHLRGKQIFDFYYNHHLTGLFDHQKVL